MQKIMPTEISKILITRMNTLKLKLTALMQSSRRHRMQEALISKNIKLNKANGRRLMQRARLTMMQKYSALLMRKEPLRKRRKL